MFYPAVVTHTTAATPPSASGTGRPLHLADLLEAMADTIGDRIAIHTAQRQYSYAEIDERSTRFAHHLVGLGIQPGDHVGIHSANRIEWVDGWPRVTGATPSSGPRPAPRMTRRR